MAFKMKGFSGFKRVDPYADQKAAKQDYYKKEKSKKENYYDKQVDKAKLEHDELVSRKKEPTTKSTVETRKKFKDTKVGKFLGVGQGEKRKARRKERRARREMKRNTK